MHANLHAGNRHVLNEICLSFDYEFLFLLTLETLEIVVV